MQDKKSAETLIDRKELLAREIQVASWWLQSEVNDRTVGRGTHACEQSDNYVLSGVVSLVPFKAHDDGGWVSLTSHRQVITQWLTPRLV